MSAQKTTSHSLKQKSLWGNSLIPTRSRVASRADERSGVDRIIGELAPLTASKASIAAVKRQDAFPFGTREQQVTPSAARKLGRNGLPVSKPPDLEAQLSHSVKTASLCNSDKAPPRSRRSLEMYSTLSVNPNLRVKVVAQPPKRFISASDLECVDVRSPEPEPRKKKPKGLPSTSSVSTSGQATPYQDSFGLAYDNASKAHDAHPVIANIIPLERKPVILLREDIPPIQDLEESARTFAKEHYYTPALGDYHANLLAEVQHGHIYRHLYHTIIEEANTRITQCATHAGGLVRDHTQSIKDVQKKLDKEKEKAEEAEKAQGMTVDELKRKLTAAERKISRLENPTKQTKTVLMDEIKDLKEERKESKEEMAKLRGKYDLEKAENQKAAAANAGLEGRLGEAQKTIEFLRGNLQR